MLGDGLASRSGWSSPALGVPVHWLDGEKIADDYADPHDGVRDSVSGRNKNGRDHACLDFIAAVRAGTATPGDAARTPEIHQRPPNGPGHPADIAAIRHGAVVHSHGAGVATRPRSSTKASSARRSGPASVGPSLCPLMGHPSRLNYLHPGAPESTVMP